MSAGRKVCLERSVVTLGWEQEHVEAFIHDLSMQRALLHSTPNLLPPEYFEQSGNAIFVRSSPTTGKPLSRYRVDAWESKPAQVVILTISLLDFLAKIHNSGTVHRNVCLDSVFIDPQTSTLSMTTYGVISTPLDFKTTLLSYVPKIFLGEELLQGTLYFPPCQSSLCHYCNVTIHKNELRKYIAIPATERVRCGLRFSPLTDLYQVGILIYSLLAKDLPVSPFHVLFERGEEGWRRAQAFSLARLQPCGLGEAFEDFLLRLLCLSNRPPFFAALEAHAEVMAIWRACNARADALLACTGTGLPPPAHTLLGFCEHMQRARINFYEAECQRILRHLLAALPMALADDLLPERAYLGVSGASVLVPALVDVPAARAALHTTADLLGRSAAVRSSLLDVDQKPGSVVSITGFRGTGKTSLVADVASFATRRLASVAVHIPMRHVECSLEGFARLFVPENFYEHDARTSAVCTDPATGSVRIVYPNETATPIFLRRAHCTSPLTRRVVAPVSFFHYVCLFVAEAVIQIDSDALRGLLARDLGGAKLGPRMPGALPGLARYLGLEPPAQPAQAVQPLPATEEYFEYALHALLSAMQQLWLLVLIVLDDVRSAALKDPIRRLFTILQKSHLGRTVVVLAETVHPIVKGDAFLLSRADPPSAAPAAAPAAAAAAPQTPPAATAAATAPAATTLTQRFLQRFRHSARQGQVLCLAAMQHVAAETDARSIISIGSEGASSVLSGASAASSLQDGASGDRAVIKGFSEFIPRPFSYGAAVHRRLPTVYCVVPYLSEDQLEVFLGRALQLVSADDPKEPCALTPEQRQAMSLHRADLTVPLYRKSGGIIATVKLLLVALYTYSGVPAPGRYLKGVVEMLPSCEIVIARQIISLRNLGKISAADLRILYTAAVFGDIFSMNWVASALQAPLEEVLSSCSNLATTHRLLVFAPFAAQLKHRMYGQAGPGPAADAGADADTGADTGAQAYEDSYSAAKSDVIFMFTSNLFRRILVENFCAASSPELLSTALYLRRRWLARGYVLERRATLRPALYLRPYSPAALQSQEFTAGLLEDVQVLLERSAGAGADAGPAAGEHAALARRLSLNMDSPSVRLALRTTRSRLVDGPAHARPGGAPAGGPAGDASRPRDLPVDTSAARAALLCWSDGSYFGIETVLRLLNPCFGLFVDVYDQYEVLRLNAYACEALGATYADVSPFVDYAERSEREVFQSLAYLCLPAKERDAWRISQYRALPHTHPLFVGPGATTAAVDEALREAVGVLGGPGCPGGPGGRGQGAVHCMVDTPEEDSRGIADVEVFLDLPQRAGQSKLGLFYNAFALLLNHTCASALTYTVAAMRLESHTGVLTQRVVPRLQEPIFQSYWPDLVWESLVNHLCLGRPARAVLIGMTFLRRLFGPDHPLSAFLPMFKLSGGVCRDSVVMGVAAMYGRELLAAHSVAVSPDSALHRVLARLSPADAANGEAVCLLRGLPQANPLEQGLQRILLLIYHALTLRNCTGMLLPFAAAAAERCLLYGASPEGVAFVGVFAALASTHVPSLSKASLFAIVTTAVECLHGDARPPRTVLVPAERGLTCYSLIHPLTSYVLAHSTLSVYPFANPSQHASLGCLKRAIFLVFSNPLESMLVQPFAFCCYAVQFFFTCRQYAAYHRLAGECYPVYNFLKSVNEQTFSECVFVLAVCCKYFALRKGATAYSATPRPREAADAEPWSSTADVSVNSRLDLPSIESVKCLAPPFYRRDSPVLASKLALTVLIEAYCAKRDLKAALYAGKRYLHIASAGESGLLHVATLCRIALLHAVAVQRGASASAGSQGVELLMLHTIGVVLKTSEGRGVYGRLLDILEAGLLTLRGGSMDRVHAMLAPYCSSSAQRYSLRRDLYNYGIEVFVDIQLFI